MANEPTYPDDSPVGAPVGREPPSEQPAEAPKDRNPEGSGRTRQLVKGAALGIGSAAVVAALLYANRSRKGSNRRS